MELLVLILTGLYDLLKVFLQVLLALELLHQLSVQLVCKQVLVEKLSGLSV
jgi:hypothetical protein